MQKVYEIAGKEFEFDFDKFRVLLRGWKSGDSYKGICETRAEFANLAGYSESTVKDWARGVHAPASIEKIADLAAALHVDEHDLLKPHRQKEVLMINNPRQVEAFNAVRIKILDVMEAAEASQFFCWNYDLKREANALIRSLVPQGIDEISGMELFYWLKSAAIRELRKQEPFLSLEMRDALTGVIEVDVERIASRDGEATFYPDPSLLVDLSEYGSNSTCEMAVACAKARTALEQATNHFIR